MKNSYFLSIFVSVILLTPASISFEYFFEQGSIIDIPTCIPDDDLNIDSNDMFNGYFTENKGQWRSEFILLGNTKFGQIAFGESGVYYDIREYEHKLGINMLNEEPENINYRDHVLKYNFIDANEVQPIGFNPMPHQNNYFIGNDPSKWVIDANNYQIVLYQDLWPGIDLRYYFTPSDLKYEFIVHPGADLKNIKTQIQGHRNLAIRSGQLVISLDNGQNLIDNDLIAFYSDNVHDNIDVRFRKMTDDVFTFELGEYDHSRPITLDPVVYSTYVTGNGWDNARGIDYDSMGNAYVAGHTFSSDFPTTPGVYDRTHNNNPDAFVLKLNPAGTALVYSTFIGGNGTEYCYGLVIDASGNAFVTGGTNSNDFPTAGSPYDSTHSGEYDVFLFKLGPSGKNLIFSTYIGDTGFDMGRGIRLDGSGYIYIAGNTSSSNYPTTTGAYDRTYGGVSDVFVTKVNVTGDKLIFSTFIGGTAGDKAYALAIDPNGNSYITGYTDNFGTLSYPTTPGAHDTTGNLLEEVIVSKLNASGDKLVYSTVVAGSNIERGYAIDLDQYGYIYVAGFTRSSGFPTTPGAFLTTYKGTSGVSLAFTLKLNITFDKLIYSTFLGDTGNDEINGIDIDSAGQAFVIGSTSSTNFPVTPDAENGSHKGGILDVFLTKFNASGTGLLYSTFRGGTGADYGYAIAVESDINIYVAGVSTSTDFPTTPGAYNRKHNAQDDCIVFKFSFQKPISPPQALAGDLGYGFVDLSWMPPMDWIEANLTGYKLYRGTTTSGESFLTELGEVMTYNDTTVKVGRTYYYYLTAVNATSESLPSNEFKAADETGPTFGLDNTPNSGTTGDNILFSIRVNDNIWVTNVSVEYWYGDTGAHENVTMIHAAGNNWILNAKLDNTLDPLNYIFHANDTSDNWVQSPQQYITLIDNDPAIFETDNTSDIATTGEAFTFSVDVNDNIEVDEVWAEYRFGSGALKNMSMTAGLGDDWSLEISIPQNSIETLYYSYHAVDTSNNGNQTSWSSVQIIDNDMPIFIKDNTFGNPTTGDGFTFNVDVLDNIQVYSIWVEHWYGQGSHENLSMINLNGDAWSLDITVPHILSSLHYIFHVNDTSSNWNKTKEKTLNIIDNDKPIFKIDNSPSTGTTGEKIIFSIEVEDNIGINNVSVEYWFGSNAHMDAALAGDGPVYELTIRAPSNSILSLNYFFKSYDTSDNLNNSQSGVITISDNDAPELWEIEKGKNAKTGETFKIEVIAIDNIKINNASCEYWFGNGNTKNINLAESEGDFTGKINVPEDSIETLHLRISVMDTSGNLNTSEIFDVEVIDNIPPSIKSIQDITITQGDAVNITVEADDNIGIKDITWSGAPIQAKGLTLAGVIDKEGNYKIKITVTDDADNSVFTSFNLTVNKKDKGEGDGDIVEGAGLMSIILLVVVIIIIIIVALVFLKKKQKKDLLPVSLMPPGLRLPPEQTPQVQKSPPPIEQPYIEPTTEPEQDFIEETGPFPSTSGSEPAPFEPSEQTPLPPPNGTLDEPESLPVEEVGYEAGSEPVIEGELPGESPSMWDPLAQAKKSESITTTGPVQPIEEEPPEQTLSDADILGSFEDVDPRYGAVQDGYKYCLQCGSQVIAGSPNCPRCGSDLFS